jgi:uncharacterized protein YbjT (DUF2867 family)
MKTVLVTSGNIGNYVAEGLAAKGVQVRVLVRKVSPNPRWQAAGIEQVAGDFNSVESLAPAFRGVQKFFSVTPFVENLVELGRNATEAAKRAGVEYIVRSSAIGASEDAPIALDRWHGQVESTIEHSGIAHTILQPNTFMQSYFMQAATIKSQHAFFLPQGEGKVSLVDVRDIAAVALVALTESGQEGKKYTLTGPEALSNQDIATKLSKVLGTSVSYIDVSEEQARKTMLSSGMPSWMVPALLELSRISKDGYLADVSPVVKQVLKRTPTSFDQFLADHAQEFTDEQAAGSAAS